MLSSSLSICENVSTAGVGIRVRGEQKKTVKMLCSSKETLLCSKSHIHCSCYNKVHVVECSMYTNRTQAMVCVHKYVDNDTIFVILHLYSTRTDLKWSNQVLNLHFEDCLISYLLCYKNWRLSPITKKPNSNTTSYHCTFHFNPPAHALLTDFI